MSAKKYQAPSIDEALAEVKRELGRDAVILQTRSFRKGGLLGIGGRRTWEIVAVENIDVPGPPVEGKYLSDGPPPAPAKQPPGPKAPVACDDAQGGDDDLARQVGQLRTMVDTLLAWGDGQSARAPVLGQVHSHLLAQDVEPQIAAALARELGLKLTGRQLDDQPFVRSELEALIASRIVICGDPTNGGARRVMAFVGPTGVGKTTTIAKLAAGFKLRQQKRVGLVTVDTYRIAAVDQLRTYAQIIDVPLRTALTPAELRRAVYQMRDMDVVLIDTTGRSPGDQLRLEELRSFLSAAQTDEVHLVVSATETRAGTRRTVENFRPLGVNRIILSKTDEAATFGVILNVAATGLAPLSYCTCGQEVPDDISPARADELARLIAGGLWQ